ncbi:MAG: UDP-N-acetylmuramoyl-L-alanyl-D-glutamate--2,6-diaminopimelate ligase, partial [Myxococcota bacterium]
MNLSTPSLQPESGFRPGISIATLVEGTDGVFRGDDVEVTHYAADSRAVGPGGLFVATRGFVSDGHDFIDTAIAQGAAAIIAETAPTDHHDDNVTWVSVPDSTYALAVVADAFHDHPSRSVKVLATTGTNGKTTIAYLLKDILEHVGARPGLLSTVEVLIDGERQPTIFTTPPAPAFQALLAKMRERGCTHALVEASSHGLQQHRLAAFDVAVAGFTNLSRDHLDYHETMEAYAAAKARLFERLSGSGCFNIDDATGAEFAAKFSAANRGPLLTVSQRGASAPESTDIVAHDATFDLAGCAARLTTPEGAFELRLQLIGPHNLENALVALGMARLADVSYPDAVAALATASGARGRLERVTVPGKAALPAVFVDYAHTPDALDNVLKALRPLVQGRLVCVFGAGGDRDKGKRPLMAAAACATADLAVVTSDNPRTEDPIVIIAEILVGLAADASHLVEADRRLAITRAIREAGPNDCVLIAGKGHEDYQIIGTTKTPFDDAEVARQVLGERAAAAEVDRA